MEMKEYMRTLWIKRISLLVCMGLITSCGGMFGRAADKLNPFDNSSVPENAYGTRDLSPLLNQGGSVDSDSERARHALESFSTYRRAHAPQPAAPVVMPAEVRLMWVPDHLNKAGDLVPAHYYYLKVMDDRWAVQDAFELEGQLNVDSGSAGSATPWRYK